MLQLVAGKSLRLTQLPAGSSYYASQYSIDPAKSHLVESEMFTQPLTNLYPESDNKYATKLAKYL